MPSNQVEVLSLQGKPIGEKMDLPKVFSAPIRPDVVQFVSTLLRKNARQPYAVNKRAGMQHSAESWGTGRAVARVPRVSGGGTHCAGQGAFANMCRKGRMFAPTQTTRKWHHKVPQKIRRLAVASAIAASSIPALVMARGHRIDNVISVPIVVEDKVQSLKRTTEALAFMHNIGVEADVDKVRDTMKLRTGVSKLRNRTKFLRKGPLIIFTEDDGLVKAFRNIQGVDLCSVHNISLKLLAPGSQVGRLVIWTKSAFCATNSLYDNKKRFELPEPQVTMTDITRVINSTEVQKVLRTQRHKTLLRKRVKPNPLVNRAAMLRLNPAAFSKKKTKKQTPRPYSAKPSKPAFVEATTVA